MKLIALAFAAAAGLAAAQLEMLQEVPECALECFTTSIASTDCGLTDFYCQCGKEAEKIQATTLKCLCSSECTTTDLAKVYNVSNKLCKSTLEEHGEEYKEPAALSEGICTSPDTPAMSASNATEGTAQPTGSNSNGTSTNGSSPAPTESSAVDIDNAAAGVGMNLAAIAVGGLAFFAL
ncbi:hypothetical protein Q7P37_003525 [Cladosporium fusiforme]